MEEVTEALMNFIRDELAKSQENRNNESVEYRLGKNEAYSKVLAVLTTKMKKHGTIL